MAGLLTHLGISLALLVIVMIASRKWMYGFVIAIGQIVPDAVKFGITGIKLKTLSPSIIIRDSLFWKLETLMTSYTFWAVLGLVIIFSSLAFYYTKKIKKKQLREINWSYLLFVIGVIVHLVIDIFVIERSYWI